MSAHELEAAPERLSAEWHARECEGDAQEAVVFQSNEDDRCTVASYDDDIEAYRDRAAKLRRLAEVEALLREVMSWINNWSPAFTDDEEWNDTAARVKTALTKEARDGE